MSSLLISQGRSAAEVAAATAATLHTLMATSSDNADDKRAAKVGRLEMATRLL